MDNVKSVSMNIHKEAISHFHFQNNSKRVDATFVSNQQCFELPRCSAFWLQ